MSTGDRPGTRVLEKGMKSLEWPPFVVEAGSFLWIGEWYEEEHTYSFVRDGCTGGHDSPEIVFSPLAWDRTRSRPLPTEGWYRVSVAMRHVVTGRRAELNDLPLPPDRRSQLERKRYARAGTWALAQKVLTANVPEVWAFFLDALRCDAERAKELYERFLPRVVEPPRGVRTVITGGGP